MNDFRCLRVCSLALTVVLTTMTAVIPIRAAHGRDWTLLSSSVDAGMLASWGAAAKLYGEGEVHEGEGEAHEGEGEPAEGEAGEGEGEKPPWLEDVPWCTYLGILGVILMALGIIWVAEGPPSPCFVATVAFGSPLAVHIGIFRVFRDEVLLQTVLGTAFVDGYYRAGPYLAGFMSDRPWTVSIARAVLTPVAYAMTLVWLAPGLWIPGILLAFLLVFLPVLLCYILKRRGVTALHTGGNRRA